MTEPRKSPEEPTDEYIDVLPGDHQVVLPGTRGYWELSPEAHQALKELDVEERMGLFRVRTILVG